MTQKQYLRDMGTLTRKSKITALLNIDRPTVRVSETIFHPQGGGQQADQGSIGPVRVTQVEHGEDGEVNHIVESLDGLDVGQEVTLKVDADRRSLNARLHSAGHLIAGITERIFPNIRAVSGHHWPGESRVEFSGVTFPTSEEIEEKLPAGLQSAIDADFPIQILGDPFTSRSIQVGDLRALPCGGTHVESTSRIGTLKIRTKCKGGNLRVSYELAESS